MLRPLSVGPGFAAALTAAQHAKNRGRVVEVPSPETRRERLATLAEHLQHLAGHPAGIDAMALTPLEELRAMSFDDDTLLHQMRVILMEKLEIRVRPVVGDIMDALALTQEELFEILFNQWGAPHTLCGAADAICNMLSPEQRAHVRQYTFWGIPGGEERLPILYAGPVPPGAR